ncbi:MAG: hypothetical protein JNL83_17415 [Myxococcales bacterium]|nr:hypothetical protein [Myxococcales bacterium]
MHTFVWSCRPVMAVLLAAAAGTGCSSATPSPVSGDAAASADAAPVAAESLTASAARSICGALFRCCDDDLAEYFAPYAANERLAAFRDRLPPAATLDEAGCRAVLEPMLDILPLGDWVRAAAAGQVRFDPAAAGRCTAALEGAACGPAVREALWDSACFGFAPPAGGVEQRSMFTRTRQAGEACTPIRDGVGASFYGTCDPAAAFCCYADPARTGCQYPFDGQGNARTGTCQATAADGARCSPTAPVQLCATGHDCDADTLTCLAPVTADLAVGAACVSAGFQLLGTCRDSYCDVLGTGTCEALRADGVACTSGEQCRSTRCDTVCVANEVCAPGGGGGAPPADAGVDAGIDASPDAAVDAAMTSNESCLLAPTLASVSTSSPAPGFTSRLAGTCGTAHDYNPLNSSGLPPACAFAYDARGREVVHAVTLSPGQRLKARLELAGGKQGALYLLDTCPGASWPDFDGTGACGSNEYAVGFCNVVGCDPANLSVTYPMMIGGQPTQPATFWLVIDEVAGDTAAGFTLDWQVQ